MGAAALPFKMCVMDSAKAYAGLLLVALVGLVMILAWPDLRPKRPK